MDAIIHNSIMAACIKVAPTNLRETVTFFVHLWYMDMYMGPTDGLRMTTAAPHGAFDGSCTRDTQESLHFKGIRNSRSLIKPV